MGIKKLKRNPLATRLLIGWREWCALPMLNIPAIKAKIDTGARTSAIHAFDIVPFRKKQVLWVKFNLHPLQANNKVIVPCVSEVIDQREVMSSNGHKEHRYVIQTELCLGGLQWPIELTLSNRDPMRFRILLGREALCSRVMIDPTCSLITKKYNHQQQISFYK